MRIAVLGGGHGAYAAAADLSEQDMEDIAAYYGQSNTTTAAKK